MKAIETVYKGYRFRSRLEARWAVFLDAMGIRWQYEVEGFELEDGTRYLPDFFLPTFCGGMWIEVKPEGGDFSKAKLFAEQMPAAIWLAEGEPRPVFYLASSIHKSCPSCDREWSDYERCFQCDRVITECYWEPCAPNWSDAKGEDRMWWDWGVGHVVHEELKYDTGDITFACLMARQARFEHGENGSNHVYH
jgi:hypothetical protein